MNELTHIDLFSGIGGFTLAAEWAGFRTVAFSEVHPYASRVLAKHWPDVPNLGDVRTIDGRQLRGATLLTGGFPCQPWSKAGSRLGVHDPRHLWPAMFNVIQTSRPDWVVGENVAGIVGMEFEEMLVDLEGAGYSVRTFIIPACGVDAPHRRDRIWIVANSEHGGIPQRRRVETISGASGDQGGIFGDVFTRSEQQTREVLAHSNGSGCEEQHSPAITAGTGFDPRRPDSGGHPWPAEPAVGRVADGVSNRAYRLHGLGNAIVPQVAYQILKAIAQIERGEIK